MLQDHGMSNFIPIYRKVIFIFYFTIGCIFAIPSIALANDFEIWISPTGSDEADGSKENPYQSIEQAHANVVKLSNRISKSLLTDNCDSTSQTKITVYLNDGLYRLGETLQFTPEVFGSKCLSVAYRAADNAKPVITGSVSVTGWRLHDAKLNIYKADIGSHYSRQLYVNGVRATRAYTQMPNNKLPAGFEAVHKVPSKNAAAKPYVIKGGFKFKPTSLNDVQWRDPYQWQNVTDIEAVIKTQWKMSRVPLANITSQEKGLGFIEMAQPAWTNANLFFNKQTNKPGIWSFWQVSYFENAYAFLDQPGEWYIDRNKKEIYYIPHKNEDMASAKVELPILETLIKAHGNAEKPVQNISFEGLEFSYATWFLPKSGETGKDGYVADQSGFHLTGNTHKPSYTGHVQHVTRTPGNLSFKYAHNIEFKRNHFTHLGAVAVDFDTGSQNTDIINNLFTDISSAAIQLSGVSKDDHHPQKEAQYTLNNTISGNVIKNIGRDFVDSAGIYIGFSKNTLVADNVISQTPWSGIAIGWGWGLLDAPGFPGIQNAHVGMWGTYKTPSQNSGNKIIGNTISDFLQDRWDGGAIYSTGQQGQSADDPLTIKGNVAFNKRPGSGGNTFYTDGGSRYIHLEENISINNPIGYVNMGPPPQGVKEGLPAYPDYAVANVIPYGGDIGGCRTFGDITYRRNFWMAGNMRGEEKLIDDIIAVLNASAKLENSVDTGLNSIINSYDKFAKIVDIYAILHNLQNPKTHKLINLPTYKTIKEENLLPELYSTEGFFDICPFKYQGKQYPTNLTYEANKAIE